MYIHFKVSPNYSENGVAVYFLVPSTLPQDIFLAVPKKKERQMKILIVDINLLMMTYVYILSGLACSKHFDSTAFMYTHAVLLFSRGPKYHIIILLN